MTSPTHRDVVGQRMRASIDSAVQRENEVLQKGDQTKEASILAGRGNPGEQFPTSDIFTSAPQVTRKVPKLPFLIGHPDDDEEKLSDSSEGLATKGGAKELFTLQPPPLPQSRASNSFTQTPSQSPTPHISCDLPRLTYTTLPQTPFALQFEEVEHYIAMEPQHGTLPVGSSQPNSVPYMPSYLQQQQTSYGSTGSNGSNNSFRTQVPLPYHLPQDYQSNSYTVASNGYAQTGSGGSLNPTSSPYIPQGDTPTLPSTGFNTTLWGAPQPPLIAPAASGGGASSYQQQQPGQQYGGMQYQGGYLYQQGEMMPVGGTIGGMGSQPQGFSNASGPYDHFSTGGNASNSFPYNTSGGQMMGSAAYVNPDMGFPTAGKNQSFGMPYTDGMNERANQMYNQQPSGGSFGLQSNQSTMYGAQLPVPSSFNSNLGTMYSGQNTAASSFSSTHSSMYGNQNHGRKTKSGSQHSKQGRPESRSSNSSGNRFQKKSSATKGKQRSNSYRGITNQPPANSTTLTLAGPVKAPKGNHVLSPEQEISKATSPEASRTSKNKVVEDTTNIATPVKLQPFNGEVAVGPSQTKTPLLRSRRGQAITAATGSMRKQSIGEWAVSVHKSSEKGAIRDLMKHLGSPVHPMSLMTLNASDPFTSSSKAIGNPFECMSLGPFTQGFRADATSQELQALTHGGTRNPTLAEAMDPYNLPFAEYCRLAKPENYGVIRIKNIPYSTTRAEVLAFLGRNAKIVNESDYEPIHIIMERVTSKTLDCFVEFIDLGEAVSAVNRFENNRIGGRGRLGQRHVEIELSTQGALMKELFPKAKNVQWDSGRPQIIPRDPADPYNSGFKGFIIKEELIMLLKHVESPQRTPFSKECPQRAFESLISTLVKYPWYMVDYITIEDRNLLHDLTKRMLEILIDRVANEDDKINLTTMLLKRVWRAALQCAGFTPSMKDDIVFIAGLDDRTALQFGLAPHASYWNKLWTLGPKPDAPVDVVLWYAAKIRQACRHIQQLSLAEQAELGTKPKELKLFGNLDEFIKYGKGLGQMTLAHVAKIEWAAIENALRRTFVATLPAPK